MTSDAEPTWARRTDEGWMLTLRVQPGAGRSAVVGTVGDALKVRVAAPANEGKANAALIRFLADAAGVPRRSITIVNGERGRDKVVAIAGPLDLARLLPKA